MKRHALYFTAPGSVAVREENLPPPPSGHALVQTLHSAISPGTEMLVYRGQFPSALAVDETITALNGAFAYPLKYGYASVGRVARVGKGVGRGWIDKLAFAFQPHQSHFTAPVESLLPVPENVDAETALFLPTMETAVNFLLDGQPLIGERVAVLGQGIVGLLTTALLALHPLASLITFDRYALRREASLALGAHLSLDPAAEPDLQADLTYELSGAPAALNTAIAVTGFDGRVVIGSWYGQKKAALDLGGRFHRSRLRLISSQVSTLTPTLTARWTKTRRLEVAWAMLRAAQPARLITHRFAFDDAAEAYALVDKHPEQCIQVALNY